MAARRAAWAEWTCNTLSKEVSIPETAADRLYITVRGKRPALSRTPPPKTRNKTPYSAHYLQAPPSGACFFVPAARTLNGTPAGAVRPVAVQLLPHTPAGVYRPSQEARPWLLFAAELSRSPHASLSWGSPRARRKARTR